jgi:large conductance mechanosensitive channel
MPINNLQGGVQLSKFIKEFKEFAVKGNAIDLAVGVIIGAALGKIVASLVNDLIMPLVGIFLGGVDFSIWKIELPRFFNQPSPIYMNIGVFINTVIEFIIIAFVVFCIIKAINNLKKKKEEAPTPCLSKEEQLLTEIRDLLSRK